MNIHGYPIHSLHGLLFYPGHDLFYPGHDLGEINRLIADLPNDDIYSFLRTYYDQDKQSELEEINREYLLQSDSFGQTMLHWAAVKGDKEIADFIIKKTGSLLFKSQTTLHNYTALHLAVHSGSTEVVKLLVDEIIQRVLTDIADIPDIHGQTALHWAASQGNAEFFRELFRAMSDSAILAKATDRQQTALHFAVHSGNNEAVRLLVDEAEKRGLACLLDIPDIHGQTALHFAASQGNVEVCRELLRLMSNQAILMKATDRQQTALHFAVHSGNNEVVQLLVEEIEKKSLDDFADVADSYGQTALHWAAGKGNAKASEILAEVMGIDQINAKTKNGNTALSFARQGGHHDIAALLIAKGAIDS